MRSQSRQHSPIAHLVMTLVPLALRRRREIREVQPEVVARGDQQPWVVQLLAEGQLPGVNAEPMLRAVEVEEVPEEEPLAPPLIVDEPTLVEVEPVLVEVEPVLMEAEPVPVEVEPEPEPEPVAEVVEAVPEPQPEPEPAPEAPPPVVEKPAKPKPAKPARKRARTTHRPVKRVTPPQRAAAHFPAPAEVEATESHSDDAAKVACEIRLWRGYRKANFFACVLSDDGEPLAVAESPSFRAHGNGVPEKTADAVAAHEQLRAQLEAAGWRYAASGRTWFGDLYSRPL